MVGNWYQENQRFVAAELQALKSILRCERASASASGVEEARAAMSSASALDWLSQLFHLSAFERNILLLCAAADLDSSIVELCPLPSFGIALAKFPGAHWSALLPVAPLRWWRLIEVGSGSSLTSSTLRIDERILHYIAGLSYLDERLSGRIVSVPPCTNVAPSHAASAEQLLRLLKDAGANQSLIVQLVGSDHSAKLRVSSCAAAASGRQLFACKGVDIPVDAAEKEVFQRLWEREALLQNAILFVEPGNAAVEHLDGFNCAVIMGHHDEIGGLPHSKVIEVHKPKPVEQYEIWKNELGPLAQRVNGELEPVVSHFDLDYETIRLAGVEIQASADKQVGEQLWSICRRRTRSSLDDLALRIVPAAAWDDLVLPESQKSILRDVATHVRGRFTVYERWGFRTKGSRGLGISALFTGSSGTGKTMAAEVLANELQLDLYRIDLSTVVSKYIGETERNLRRVFDSAEASGAILLFDEADALFGKRSEVRDSHDRYANIEISYLLQRMEAYRGLAILTTNLKSAMDTAFLRRIRFVVEFPFPDMAQRAEIWQRVFPSGARTEALDHRKLARLNIAGGNIRNIAVSAAFFAAEKNRPIRMEHLLQAARAEYTKLEKPLTSTETGGWIS